MKKLIKKAIFLLIFILSFAIFGIHGVLAANITADDTPCNSFTELYVDGNNLPITEYCLIRSCFSENRSAQFYFKYSKNHKEKQMITMKDYETGLFSWSTGQELSLGFNESKKVDVDNNGYYDQKVWYEIDKPDIHQICLKIYELKEGSQYKVPSASTLALLSKNSSTTSTALNTSKVNSSNITNVTVIDLSANLSLNNQTNAANAASNEEAQLPAAVVPIQQPSSEQKNESLEIVKSKTEITEQGQTDKTQTTESGTADAISSNNRIVIGVSIIVFIALLIVIGFLIYERKKKHDFSVMINEEIGHVDLGKKE